MKWSDCKNILCIRADNMGDIIMSTPAFRALKQTFGCRLTLLTSAMGNLIAPFIEDIDETIVFDVPWIKINNDHEPKNLSALTEKISSYHFDGAIIFTVYSQSALPAAMLAYMANIPLRLACCRENPYGLLTHWFADKEPYVFIQHQVKRDLNLVESIGAKTSDEKLAVRFGKQAYQSAIKKLKVIGFNTDATWIIAHAGVSETKREYPETLWIKTINLLQQRTDIQVLLTGSANEKALTQSIQQKTNDNVFSIAGLLTVKEFIALIAHTKLVISVNTAAMHIAVAVNTPVIALYALTNPQHTPWHSKHKLLPFSIPEHSASKNEVIQFVNKNCFQTTIEYPSPAEIVKHALQFLNVYEVNLSPVNS